MAISSVGSAEWLSTTSNSDIRATIHADTQVGDLILVGYGNVANEGALTATPQSGWVTIQETLDGTNAYFILLGKIATSTEVNAAGTNISVATYGNGTNGQTNRASATLTYRGTKSTVASAVIDSNLVHETTPDDETINTGSATATASDQWYAMFFSMAAGSANGDQTSGSFSADAGTMRQQACSYNGSTNAGVSAGDSNGTISAAAHSRNGTWSINSTRLNAAIAILAPAAITNASAGSVSTTATSNAPVAAVRPQPTTVTATVTANNPTVSITADRNAPAGPVPVTAASNTPIASVTPRPGAVGVTATANNATVTTQANTTANAGHAAVSATANSPTVTTETEIQFISSSTFSVTNGALSANVEFTMPSGIQVGDTLLVAYGNVGNYRQETNSDPTMESGWRLVDNVTDTTNCYMLVAAKDVTSTDVSNIGTTVLLATLPATTGTTYRTAHCTAYRNATPVSSNFPDSALVHEDLPGDATVNTGSATNTANSDWYVCAFNAATGGGGGPGTWSSTAPGDRGESTAGTTGLVSNTGIFDSNGPIGSVAAQSKNGTISFTPSRLNGWIGILTKDTGETLAGHVTSTGTANSPTTGLTAKPIVLAISDTFDRTDSTTLGTVSSGGYTWTEQNGTALSISGNKLATSALSNTQAYIDTGLSDYDVSVTVVTASGTDRTGILFRNINSGNHWRLLRASNGTATVYRTTGGASDGSWTSSTTVNAGDVLRVVNSGSSITCYVNDTQTHSITDSTHGTATQVGLTIIETGATLDNFNLTSSTPIIKVTANDATVATGGSGGTNANAGAVSSTVTANNATVQIGLRVSAGHANPIATANNVSASIVNGGGTTQAPAGLASVSVDVPSSFVTGPPVPNLTESKTLVLGPGRIYIADFGAEEPVNAQVGGTPNASIWTDLGGLLGGVELHIEEEWKTIDLLQVPGEPIRRLQKRKLEVTTELAEATLLNLTRVLNDSAPTSGAGFQTYSAPLAIDQATVLTYKALIIQGWAPRLRSDTKRHRQRMILMRKCLSISGVSTSYKRDGQTTFKVTWAVHYVDGTTPPFKVIDEGP